jgi:3D (Asp-Asp-Asp) domain-containing protein
MSSIYYPARGFFIGKAGKYLKVLVVVGLLAFPATIQADTATPHPQSTALAVSAATPTSAGPSIVPNTKTVWVTAYTSDPDETSDHPLITASGGLVSDGIVAANFLPFGTQIQIPALFGDKVFVVEDRTSPKFGGRVDIWMPTYSKALNFGIQSAQIVILDSNLALR